jgi:hypothetical protein
LRRLSLATLVSFVVGLGTGAASAEVGSSLAHRSADLTRSYLHTWSTNGRAALADVPRLYAPQVSFYGRLLNHGALTREKAQFLRRWPIRHYALRPGTMRVTCDAQGQRCAVRSIIDWRAASSARKVSSRGSSTFEQEMDFAASRPLIFRESGAVIPQRNPAGAVDFPAATNRVSRPGIKIPACPQGTSRDGNSTGRPKRDHAAF